MVSSATVQSSQQALVSAGAGCKRRPWTNREVARLRILACQGLRVSAIGADLKRCDQSIVSRARQEGIALPKRTDYWTAEEHATLSCLTEQGASYKRMMEELPGRSYQGIAYQIHILGLRKRAA